MNPVYHSQTPVNCSICFDDKTGPSVLWHKKISIDSRNHTACVDCASAHLKMTAEAFELNQRVNCPDCRKEIVVINTSTFSQKLLSLAFKVSLGYLFFQSVGQPISLMFYKRLSLKSELTPIIDDWCYNSLSETAESIVHHQIAELILHGNAKEIKKELFRFVNYDYSMMLSFLVASSSVIYREIFELNLNAKQKRNLVLCILFQHMFYLFYHKELYSAKIDNVDRISNYLWTNSCPIRSYHPDFLSCIMKLFITFIPLLIMHINTINKDSISTLSKERISQDFLNGNIRFKEA